MQKEIIIFFIFIFNILFLLFIIAVLTLIERKILSLVQRRLGPYYIGYKGKLQYIADFLKLISKNINLLFKINNFFYFFLPSFVFIFCFTL